MQNKKTLCLSEFIIKIIAFITMFLDHLGIFLEMVPGQFQFAHVCRLIGRISFPLFIFMIVEGVMHTKHFGKYILRLGILDLLIIIGETIIYYNIYNGLNYPSPITDLVFISLTIYLLKRKDKFSFLSILPMGYIIFSFIVNSIEFNNHITINFLPFYLRCGYSIFGLLLALGFYFTSEMSKWFLKYKKLEGDVYLQPCKNILSALVIIFVSIIFFLINNYTRFETGLFSTDWACFAALPILFYSGTRGYNAKWWQYGSYLFFPLHLVILFAIFYFTGLLGGIL